MPLTPRWLRLNEVKYSNLPRKLRPRLNFLLLRCLHAPVLISVMCAMKQMVSLSTRWAISFCLIDELSSCLMDELWTAFSTFGKSSLAIPESMLEHYFGRRSPTREGELPMQVRDTKSYQPPVTVQIHNLVKVHWRSTGNRVKCL